VRWNAGRRTRRCGGRAMGQDGGSPLISVFCGPGRVVDGKEMMIGWRGLAGLAVLIGISAACQQNEADCIPPPCAPRMAITLTVVSAAGGPVPDLTFTLSGLASGSGQCSAGPSATSCIVLGMAGTYDMRLTAPGFQDRTLSVTVQGSTPPCGCPSVQPERLEIVLDPK
jgi:hypothetical protein